MLETNRRSLLVSTVSLLIASPAVIKAASLMDLRGYNLDPLLVSYDSGDIEGILSQFDPVINYARRSYLRTESEDEVMGVLNVKDINARVRTLNLAKPYGPGVVYKARRFSEMEPLEQKYLESQPDKLHQIRYR